MARLAGVDIPREKRVEIALTYIYGVGRTRALETLKATGISGDIRVKDLSDEQLVALRDHIEGTYKVDVAVHKIDGYPYDYHRLLYTFRVKSRTKDVGIYRPRHTWRFSGGVRFAETPGPRDSES